MPAIVYIVLISSFACLGMIFLPSLAFINGIVWGISILLGGYFLSRKHIIIIFGFNILLLYGLAGSSILFLLLVFGIPSLIMGLLLADQKGYYELQKWGMLAALVLTSLFVGLAYDSIEDVSKTYIQTEFNQHLSENSAMLGFYEEQGLSQEELQSSLAAATDWIVMHLPAFYYIHAILAVYFILVLSAYISQKKKIPILLRKPFQEEKMPWQFAWVVILAISLWLLGKDDLTSLYYIGSNLILVATPVTIYYGLSVLIYHWSRTSPRTRRWHLIIFSILLLILTLPVTIFISLIGLFDSLLDYRKLDHKKEVTR